MTSERLSRLRRDPLIGHRVAGRYEILDHIGDGGMGVVYKARQEPIGRLVALKVLLPTMSADETAVTRFLNEARIISTLRHATTVKLIDLGKTRDGRLFIAMDYLAGGQLRDLLHKGRLEVVAALRIVRQICQSLAEAHTLGVIHRDLKPENILLDEVPGESFVVRVVDFGVAKLKDRAFSGGNGDGCDHPQCPWPDRNAVLTAPGMRLGTLEYMAPEQALDMTGRIDGRADLYAVGVMLYEMLTGYLPFESESSVELSMQHAHAEPRALRSVAPDLEVDAEVEILLMQLLAKEVDKRPFDAGEVVRRVEQMLSRLAPPGTSDGSRSQPAYDAIRPVTPKRPPTEHGLEDAKVFRRERRLKIVVGAALASALLAAAAALMV